MRFLKFCGALAALVLVAACSSTTSTVSDATQAENTVAAADAEGNEEGVICERVPVTGTRFTEKVCTTAAQREARARNARDAASQVGVRAQQVGGPAGGQ